MALSDYLEREAMDSLGGSVDAFLRQDISLGIEKLNTLQDKSKAKLIRVYGLESADTYITSEGKIKGVTSNGIKYESIKYAEDIQSLYWEDSIQKEAHYKYAAKFLNKPIEEVTDSDIIDIGDYQKRLKEADLLGIDKGIVSFVPNVADRPKLVEARLGRDVMMTSLGTDEYGRTLGNIVTQEGLNIDDIAANDPLTNIHYYDNNGLSYELKESEPKSTNDRDLVWQIGTVVAVSIVGGFLWIAKRRSKIKALDSEDKVSQIGSSQKTNDFEDEEEIEIKSDYLFLKEYFTVLDIAITTDLSVIKKAYRTKMNEYHPDKVSKLGIELQKLAEQKTKEINIAYETIVKHLKSESKI